MGKEEFVKKLIEAGFEKQDDLMFPYKKEIISNDEAIENNLEYDQIPELLFGFTELNKGFCIYTGSHFIFINAKTPKEAIDFASKIVAFEEV